MRYARFPLLTVLALGLAGCPADAECVNPIFLTQESCEAAGHEWSSREQPLQSIECDACGGDCLIEQYAVNSASHISGGVDYENPPPVGGNHDPCWAPYGVHETEVPDENWVHNLEHGAVVMLYNCPSGCPEDVAVLEAVAAAVEPGTTLVSPYSSMPPGFAAVSWAWRITLGCADQAALQDFYVEHAGQAPEDTSAAPPSGCMD